MQTSTEQSRRILIIDDEKITRITLSKVLRKSGYDIIEAENGEAGIVLCQQEKPDLVLLDVIMPGIDGYETCRQIRKIYKYESLPIIMLTGLNDVDSVDNAFDAGATDFITKPINWSLLGQRVRYSIHSRELYEEIHRGQAKMIQAQVIAKMGYWDMSYDNQALNCSDELINILGIGSNDKRQSVEDFVSLVHAEDRPLVNKKILAAINYKLASQFEHRIIRPDGKLIFVTHKVETIDDADHDFSLIGIVQDITEQKENEAIIKHQRYYDALTNLANKQNFIEHLDEVLDSTGRLNKIRGVYFLSIDKYKSVTNALGHVAGDTLIQLAAERIKPLQKKGYFISRYSEDVFALVGPEVSHIDETSEMAAQIINTCQGVFNIDGNEVYSTTSIGVSVIPLDADNTGTIIKGAESAMNLARDTGGDKYQYFSEEMNRLAQERLVLEKDIRSGIHNNEFTVYYQPQVSTSSGKVIGMEALVRWNHPQRGIVSPLDFIPIAEESGLIMQLGSTVLYEACRQTKQWFDEGLGLLRVGVNLSPRQFINHNLVQEVCQILADTGLPPELLDMEITESMAVDNLENVVNYLQSFKKMGISTSMDDFGTGHSSLSMLQELPLDILKIDRSFIKNIGNGDSGAIASAIIAMSHSMSLRVIAEGVETDEQLSFVQNCNCDEIQGFYYSKPLPADEFREFVIQHNHLTMDAHKAI